MSPVLKEVDANSCDSLIAHPHMPPGLPPANKIIMDYMHDDDDDDASAGHALGMCGCVIRLLQ
jgi:hypothetical protein